MTVTVADLRARFSADTRDLEAGTKRAERAINALVKETRNAAREARSGASSFGGFGSAASSAFSPIGSLARVGTTSILGLTAAAAGATVGVVALGASFVSAANQLNAGFANVASLGVANDRVVELKGNVQDMSIVTGKTTDDLTAGLYQVVSAFGDSADTAKILDINARAAAGGVAETLDAINLTSAVTKGYGDTSAAAVLQVADLALKTVELGQTTFPELASSIGKVVPLSKELGISQEELFAVMATGSGVTGTASEVSTQYRGILQSFLAPTKTAALLFETMGFASGEAMIQQLGFADSMGVMVAASERSGIPLQEFIGSIEGQTLALALAGPQAAKYQQNLVAMGSAAGKTDQAFRAQTEGVNKIGFKLQQAANWWTVYRQKAGDAINRVAESLLPSIEPVLTGLAGRLEAFIPVAEAWVNDLITTFQQTGKVNIGDWFSLDTTGEGTKLKITDWFSLDTTGGLKITALNLFTLDQTADKTLLKIGDWFTWDVTTGKLTLGAQQVDATSPPAKTPLQPDSWFSWSPDGKLVINPGVLFGPPAPTGQKEPLKTSDWFEWDTSNVNGKLEITTANFHLVSEPGGKNLLEIGDWFSWNPDSGLKITSSNFSIDTTGEKKNLSFGDWFQWGEGQGFKITSDAFSIDTTGGKTRLKVGDWYEWEKANGKTKVKIGDFYELEQSETAVTKLKFGDWYQFEQSEDGGKTKVKIGDFYELATDGGKTTMKLGDFFSIDPSGFIKLKIGDVLEFNSSGINLKFLATKLTWSDVFAFTLAWSPTIAAAIQWAEVFGFDLNWRPTVTIDWPPVPPIFQWLFGGGASRVDTETGTHAFPRNPRPVEESGGWFDWLPGNAAGTNNFAGGWTWVGEEGPELLNLPAGSKILSNPNSMAMIGQMATGNTNLPGGVPGSVLGGGTTASPLTSNLLAKIDQFASKVGNKFDKSLDKFSRNLEGMLSKVPGLFGASPVTKDQMDLAALGVPQNFADDWLRRMADEVYNGVDWADVDLQDAAQRAGIDPSLPAEAIYKMVASQWNDSSFFAGGKNLDKINQSAVQESLARQRDAASGRDAIMALFGVTPEQFQGQAVALGGQLSTGITQGMTSGASGGSLSGGVISNLSAGITPEAAAPIATALANSIAAALSQGDDKDKSGIDFGGQFVGAISNNISHSDALQGLGPVVLGKIVDGWDDVQGIDFGGKMAGAMRVNIGSKDSISTLMDVGEKIFDIVLKGYEQGAKQADYVSPIADGVSSGPAAPASQASQVSPPAQAQSATVQAATTQPTVNHYHTHNYNISNRMDARETARLVLREAARN